MLVDLSHTSYKTMLDALDISKSPVIFSHSCVYSICNSTRNVRDDVLLKLKANNGVIMINFYNNFVTCNNIATLEDVKKHINYVVNITQSYNHVGIGGDFDGVSRTPSGLEDVSKYPNLFASLLADGWSEENLAKLAGGNILRVLEDNEIYSKSVKNQSPEEELIEDAYIINAGHKLCRT